MTTSTLPQPKEATGRERWARAQHGLIGIDIGFRETKVAQVVRQGREPHLRASWRFPTVRFGEAPLWEDFEGTIDAVAKEFNKLRPMFRGRRIALSIPFAHTPLRLVDVPRGDTAEMRCMIREELAAEFHEDDICFDYWDTAAGSGDEGSVAQLAVMMVPAQRSQSIAQRFVRDGFDCRFLDAGLCGLARLTALNGEKGSPAKPQVEESASPYSLVIDLGWTSTRLLFVQQGEPRFCRVLAEVGCQAFVQSLRDRLQVSESEASLLLRKIGVGKPGHVALAGPASEIHSCLAPVLVHLTTEIRRTLQFVNRQLRSQTPSRMWLFGGGAEIRHLDQHFAKDFQLPVDKWQLSSSASAGQESQEAAFAGAIALSLLAWEDR